jgi:hypothetical protein
MATKLPMIYTYVSEEEKKAFEILAKLESRSFSNLLRLAIVNMVKDRGLLKEEVNEKGEIVQTVTVTKAGDCCDE